MLLKIHIFDRVYIDIRKIRTADFFPRQIYKYAGAFSGKTALTFEIYIYYYTAEKNSRSIAADNNHKIIIRRLCVCVCVLWVCSFQVVSAIFRGQYWVLLAFAAAMRHTPRGFYIYTLSLSLGLRAHSDRLHRHYISHPAGRKFLDYLHRIRHVHVTERFAVVARVLFLEASEWQHFFFYSNQWWSSLEATDREIYYTFVTLCLRFDLVGFDARRFEYTYGVMRIFWKSRKTDV